MRTLFISFILFLLVLPFTNGKKTVDEYRIMSCNIRITGLEDDAPFPERVWENRRDLCVNTILKRQPDFFCMQEVIYDSYEYFKQKCKKYTSYGFVGPEMDPYTNGYHFIGKNVIFFRTDKFELVGSGCYWLSDDPLIGGSMSWGTNRARHCNWVRLKDKETGRQFRLLNIHLDHKSDSARREQIKIIIRECAQYADNFPQIICGDFNAGIKSAPIKYIHAQKGWNEMYEDIHGMDEYGYTCHGFLGLERQGTGRRIDFIFHHGNVQPLKCEVVKDHIDKMYPSDHYFLDATFKLK